MIIPDVCNALYDALKDAYLKVPSSSAEWDKVASDFAEKWNFPKCIGAIDGKHIVVQAPINSGSYYYKYKNTHSLVLMALVDANYKFIYIDVGGNGRISDVGIYRACSLQEKIENNLLEIPVTTLTWNRPNMPYIIVRDKAFPLKEYLMKPYPQRTGLDDSNRIFNYRLSRARRVVENAFGIPNQKFRVFRASILLDPFKVEKVVLCCCALHNFSRPESVGQNEKNVIEDTLTDTYNVFRGGNRSSNNARKIRDEFKDYFRSIGKVSFQGRVLN